MYPLGSPVSAKIASDSMASRWAGRVGRGECGAPISTVHWPAYAPWRCMLSRPEALGAPAQLTHCRPLQVPDAAPSGGQEPPVRERGSPPWRLCGRASIAPRRSEDFAGRLPEHSRCSEMLATGSPSAVILTTACRKALASLRSVGSTQPRAARPPLRQCLHLAGS